MASGIGPVDRSVLVGAHTGGAPVDRTLPGDPRGQPVCLGGGCPSSITEPDGLAVRDGHDVSERQPLTVHGDHGDTLARGPARDYELATLCPTGRILCRVLSVPRVRVVLSADNGRPMPPGGTLPEHIRGQAS